MKHNERNGVEKSRPVQESKTGTPLLPFEPPGRDFSTVAPLSLSDFEWLLTQKPNSGFASCHGTTLLDPSTIQLKIIKQYLQTSSKRDKYE